VKYRKRPIVIDAIQWTGENWEEVREFCRRLDGFSAVVFWDHGDDAVFIDTLEGTMRAGLGWYIIRGAHGEFYPCRADVFRDTYEPVVDKELEDAP
jgi:hypothetical protein